MIDTVLSFIAPHPCCGCGKPTGLLCEDCKYDIISDVFQGCLGCLRPAGATGVCGRCRLPYSKAWCVGERSGSLEELINRYKFERAREAHQSLAALLGQVLPDLPVGIIIVPVPTIARHIRERGYDHTLLLAKALGKQLGRRVATPLVRATQTAQRDVSRARRISQAKQAFKANGVEEGAHYLLIDDVVTTGATLRYASEALRDAGAREVWVAAVSRQPLH